MQGAIWTFVGVAFESQGCHVGPLPSVPDVSGTYISHSATIQADKKTVDEILRTFKQAEEAIAVVAHILESEAALISSAAEKLASAH